MVWETVVVRACIDSEIVAFVGVNLYTDFSSLQTITI